MDESEIKWVHDFLENNDFLEEIKMIFNEKQ